MHGAGGGAPKGNRNARRHGLFGREAVETRRMVAELTKQAQILARSILIEACLGRTRDPQDVPFGFHGGGKRPPVKKAGDSQRRDAELNGK